MEKTAQDKRDTRFHMPFAERDCSLCGRRDYTATVSLVWTVIQICGGCLAHMGGLYDEFKKDQQHEAQA